MGLREPDFTRFTQSIAATSTATLTTALQAVGLDRISGEQGLYKMKFTVVAASGGLLSVTVRVGQRQQIQSYAIPAEEAVGAGPTSRIAALTVRGYRGDPILIAVTNPTGGAVVVTTEIGLLNSGR
jgi:hypothetical protein